MTGQAFVEELEKVVSEPETGTAVLALAVPGESLARRFRHNAPLVTQLWAAKLDAPQARARRRAAPEEGVAAYGQTGETIVRGRRARGASWAA